MKLRDNYRDFLVEQIKCAGQELIDRAEQIAASGLSEITGLDIWISLSSLNEQPLEIEWTTKVLSRNAIDYMRGFDKKPKPMTCKERLMIEHPEKVDNQFTGGCEACPDNYGYARRPDKCFPNRRGNDKECAECWDRAVEEV